MKVLVLKCAPEVLDDIKPFQLSANYVSQDFFVNVCSFFFHGDNGSCILNNLERPNTLNNAKSVGGPN